MTTNGKYHIVIPTVTPSAHQHRGPITERNGPKIQKTNRIRLKQTTVYCSCDIVREVRPLLERLHQVLAPKKGKTDELFYQLCVLANTPKWRNHFPDSTREWLARGVI